MSDPDVYTALGSEGFAETKVKGSRFLGFAFPVRNAGEAGERMETLRKKYHDATHVCFGWRIGHGDGYEQKAADAGEPFGTAGTPIVHALERAGASDGLVAVVRYYGGVKLGTGGLIRAYGGCAREAIEDASLLSRTLRAPLAVLFAYPQAGAVLRLAEKHRARTTRSDYGEEVRLDLAVPASRVERLKTELIEATAGAVRFP